MMKWSSKHCLGVLAGCSVWLVVQFGWLFSLAGCSVWLVVQFGWLFSLAGCLVQLIVVCMKLGT